MAELSSAGGAPVAAGLSFGVAVGLSATGDAELSTAGWPVLGCGGTGAFFWAARRASISFKNATHGGFQWRVIREPTAYFCFEDVATF